MRHFDILLPFALPPPELAADLMRQLDAPSLAMLTSRARRQDRESDPFSRCLPHESWLAAQFGLAAGADGAASPPCALASMQAAVVPPEDCRQGHWFMLQPAHLHIARDHLVLTDLRQLKLSEAESRSLFADTAPLFAESGRALHYGDALTWYLRADDWHGLQTSTPDAACGHNIDIWMPQGPGERDWRKLLNEVQMLWHTHPVNAAREERRGEPVNSLWLWGGTPQGTVAATEYGEAFNLPGWARGAAMQAGLAPADGGAPQALSAPRERGLVVLDALAGPALAEDWGEWLARLHTLEKEWLAPSLDALKAGKMESVSIIASHGSRLRIFSAQRSALRKFWIKPSLSRLAS